MKEAKINISKFVWFSGLVLFFLVGSNYSLEKGIYQDQCQIEWRKRGDLDGDKKQDLAWICKKQENYLLYITTQKRMFMISLEPKALINQFDLVNYRVGMGMGIKIVLDFIDESLRWDYKGKVELYHIEEKKRLVKSFSYEVYKIKSGLRSESVEYVDMEFENIDGDEMKEIQIRKKRIERVYGHVQDIRKNHREKVYRGKKLYFKYDKKLRKYKKYKFGLRNKKK